MLWTGDGTLPTGESTEAHAVELGFSEAMDSASMTNATATLTPEGGSAVNFSVALGPDGRSAELTGAELVAGTNYALHFEGLKDRSGNALQPEDRMLNVADPESFEVISDTSAPVLLAVMDGSDGIYLLFDEAVQSADMASAIQLKRQGDLVEGESQRVNPRVLKWNSTSTDLGGGFFLGAQYSLSVVGVEDLAGNPADASGMSFTHLAGSEGQLLVARQAPTDSYLMAESAYGLTTLFQGRTWHADLGMYYYRARWYLPDGGVFGERDPFEYVDSPDLYQFVGYSPNNIRDPMGTLNWGNLNRRAWDWEKGGGKEANARLGRALSKALEVLYDAYRGGRAAINNDLSTQVDLSAKYFFGIRAEDVRRSYGIQRRVAAGVPYAGASVGDNLQVFYRGGLDFVAAIFTFDTGHDWALYRRREMPRVKGVPVYGPTGFQGGELSWSVGTNYALNIMPEKNSELSGEELTAAWSGHFHSFSVAPPVGNLPVGPGVSGFASENFIGVEKSLGIGGGASLAHEYYIPQIGPVYLRSPAAVIHIAKLYYQGAHLKKAVRDLMRDFGLVK